VVVNNLNFMSVHAVLAHSPIQQVNIDGFDIYVKRDDLLNPHFSGNKARKFAYYLDQTLTNISKIVGYGSIQANSLYSLAALANMKGWQFDYYVDRIPTWLNNSSLGNYAQAQQLGANVIERTSLVLNESNEDKNLDTLMHCYAKTLPDTSLFIAEGGRSTTAQYGVNVLAQEIADYCAEQHWFDHHPVINIMLPAGTGTTALYLQTWFYENNIPIKVLTCACVGDADYLQQQFAELNINKNHWPQILPTLKKYHFGKLYAHHYRLWSRLKQQTDIEFDLLYDPIGWETLLNYLQLPEYASSTTKTPIIYIHQGGLIGNQSMIPRYQRKYPELA